MKIVNDMRLKNALGLAQKAGKAASGGFAAEKAIRSGKAKLIVLDETASENTEKQWRSACAYRNVPFITVNGLAEAIGKPGRTVAAITDENFSAMIIGNCSVNTGNNVDNNADSYGGRA